MAPIPNRLLTALTTVVVLTGTALLGASTASAATADCKAFQSEARHLVRPTDAASLLTRSATEARSAMDVYGFTDDRGVIGRVATQSGVGLVPVWRLFRGGDFVWALDGADADRFAASGYARQRVDFYAGTTAQSCLTAVYRLTRGGVHRVATRAQTLGLSADGWVGDGSKFYIAPGPAPAAAPLPPAPGTDTTFSIALIPDTQNETSSSASTRFANRVSWLVANKAGLDLRYAIQIGDLSSWGHVAPAQFQKASTEIRPLEAVVPWSVAAGNHDTAAVCAGGSACPGANTSVTVRDVSTFNRYFPPSRFPALGGTYEAGHSENSWSTFSAGGRKWLVLTLELWARPAVVTWAQGVVASHPDHNVIVNTHAYLNSDGTISTSNGGYGSTSPRFLYDNLVRRYPNVVMVASGHVGQAAVRTDTGDAGNRVVSFLQAFHSTTNPVRLVEINTAAGTVTSRVYAPEVNTSYPAYTTSTAGMRFR
ncbi:metallophosphoesterase [Oryzobacter terrae]|uniref:metallophosphoesterase n=1 Tax=Oryzobacter terrae TaxID=1620385 RepID=UPI00366CF44A